MITSYTITAAQSYAALAEAVQRRLPTGWQPQGGPYFCALTNTHCQAMVKHDVHEQFVWPHANGEDLGVTPR